MIKLYPYESLGISNHGWLQSHFHFSFADYYNPGRTQFGTLRVINDDIIAPHSGFETHPHRDMEIITYVRQGAITHQDSMGNKGKTMAGDVQVMSAGTGIAHSEHNHEDEETRLYQIWIYPRENGVKPRWEQRQFPKATNSSALTLLVSGYEQDKDQNVLFIHQDAAIYGGRIEAGATIHHHIRNKAYILLAEGKAVIDGVEMKKGDGAEVTDLSKIEIKAYLETEILVMDIA